MDSMLARVRHFLPAYLCYMVLLAMGNSHATCVFVNKYETPDGRSVFCLGDWHEGKHDDAVAEQDAFIEIAKKRNAHCIIEDVLGYTGDNYKLRDSFDAIYYDRLMSWSEKFSHHMSALPDLANRCMAKGIDYVNIECRYELHSLYKNRGRTQNNADVLLSEKLWEEINDCIQKGYLSEFVDFKQRRVSVRALKVPISFGYAFDITSWLVDALVVRRLDELLVCDDMRPIFIFTGMSHLRGVGAHLRHKWQCQNSSDDAVSSKRLKRTFFDRKRRLRSETSEQAWQDGVQRLIDTYAVNIAEYFADEECESERVRVRGCVREKSGKSNCVAQ